MEKEAVQGISFQLVAHAGEASACFFDAVELARQGDFDAAEAKLSQGTSSLNEAHDSQTDLLRCEVNGEDIAFSLLLVHAQDHLMSTILLERMARELIEVYRRMADDE